MALRRMQSLPNCGASESGQPICCGLGQALGLVRLSALYEAPGPQKQAKHGCAAECRLSNVPDLQQSRDLPPKQDSEWTSQVLASVKDTESLWQQPSSTLEEKQQVYLLLLY